MSNAARVIDVANALQASDELSNEAALIYLDEFYTELVREIGTEAIEVWWLGTDLYDSRMEEAA